ncbi:MAG TPA: hypothetical protein VFC67_12075 [Prolixibacteraceae bacterium]|nr:hypothetical protein [Prolixibacteraceae bacterium]
MNQDQKSIKKVSTATLNSQTVLLKSSVAAGTLPGLLGCQNKSGAKMIGIQIGPVSFVDEGIENVLDILQDRGAVNTIFLSTFSYDRGISGRQIPGRPFPDHGVQKSDEKYFHGGNYAKPHPKFYQNTELKGENMRAPDFGDLDIVAEVLPAAKKRGMKVFCSVLDGFNYPDDVPDFKKFAEINLHGQKGEALCFYRPDVRAFWTGLVTDLCMSYDIDGILLFNERGGPLLNSLGASHNQNIASSRVTCFCEYHQKAARELGIDFQRARQGYLKLDNFVQASLKGQRPSDGYYVEFARILLEYPEIVAWNKLFDLGKSQVLSDVSKAVKNVSKNLQVGFHIEHVNSFNPIYRAARSYADLATKADFLKVVVYNNAGGERYANFIQNAGSIVFRDVPPEELMRFNNHLLNYSKDEASFDKISEAGLSPDYVFRETQRAIAGVKGKCKILPGIDVNIPTGMNSRKASPEDTYAATLSALKAGADGIILSRKYSEMQLANLSAAGRAVRDTEKD